MDMPSNNMLSSYWWQFEIPCRSCEHALLSPQRNFSEESGDAWEIYARGKLVNIMTFVAKNAIPCWYKLVVVLEEQPKMDVTKREGRQIICHWGLNSLEETWRRIWSREFWLPNTRLCLSEYVMFLAHELWKEKISLNIQRKNGPYRPFGEDQRRFITLTEGVC